MSCWERHLSGFSPHLQQMFCSLISFYGKNINFVLIGGKRPPYDSLEGKVWRTKHMLHKSIDSSVSYQFWGINRAKMLYFLLAQVVMGMMSGIGTLGRIEPWGHVIHSKYIFSSFQLACSEWESFDLHMHLICENTFYVLLKTRDLKCRTPFSWSRNVGSLLYKWILVTN